MRKSENVEKWVRAPINGKDVELDGFSWLKEGDSWSIEYQGKGAYLFALKDDERHILSVVVTEMSITILCEGKATEEDLIRLMDDITRDVNESDASNLYGVWFNNAKFGVIIFYWT